MIFKKILFLLLLIGLTLGCRMVSGLFDKSGTLLVIEVKSDEPDIEKITAQAVNILQNRMDALGVRNEVSKTLPNQLEVKIYGDNDLERAKKILLAKGSFEINKVVTEPNPAPIKVYQSKEAALESLKGKVSKNPNKVLSYNKSGDKSKQSTQPTEWIIVETPPIIDGSEVRDAQAYSRSGQDRDYVITFSLNKSGAQKFGDWTTRNINNYLAIVLNDEVKSAAFIKSPIYDSGEITGNFTKQEAEDLALIMTSGYLPANLILTDEKTFGK